MPLWIDQIGDLLSHQMLSQPEAASIQALNINSCSQPAHVTDPALQGPTLDSAREWLPTSPAEPAPCSMFFAGQSLASLKCVAFASHLTSLRCPP